MAESRFASSGEIVDDQLKLNTKWANERKFNPEQCNLSKTVQKLEIFWVQEDEIREESWN